MIMVLDAPLGSRTRQDWSEEECSALIRITRRQARLRAGDVVVVVVEILPLSRAAYSALTWGALHGVRRAPPVSAATCPTIPRGHTPARSTLGP